MPVLTDQDRKYRDIYYFVLARLQQKVGDEQKFRYAAILEMARSRFYLSSKSIAEIVRNFVPEEPDLAQLDLF
ncbi:MAG: hypothetical protein ABI432_08745, partial [Flavobacteriales bacterium]